VRVTVNRHGERPFPDEAEAGVGYLYRAGGTGKAALDQAEAVALMPTLDAVFARHVEPSLGSSRADEHVWFI
jgi:hypothetical protein